jgi:MFS family permease
VAEAPRRRLTYGLTRNIFLLAIASLLTDVSSEIIIPLLPLFMLSLGATFLIIGIVEGIAESAVSLLKLVSGHISDRFGRRKPFVALGYGVSTVMKTILPVATVWPHVLVARLGDRVGKGVRDPPRDALIAESTRPETVGKAFGFHRTMDTTGAVLGSVLVLILFPIFAAQRGEAQAFRDLFLLAVIPAALAFVVILAVREVAAKPKMALRFKVSLRALPVRLRLFVLVAAIYSLANFSILLLIAYVADRMGGPTLAVIDYVMFNIVYALLAVQAGTLSDRVGRKPVLLVGYGAFIAGCVGFALVREPFVLVAFFILFGISYAFVEGTQRALVVDLSPAELKATSLGTYHAAVGLGKLPSSILAGLLVVAFSPSVMFLSHASIAIVAATLFIGAFGERRHPDEDGATGRGAA